MSTLFTAVSVEEQEIVAGGLLVEKQLIVATGLPSETLQSTQFAGPYSSRVSLNLKKPSQALQSTQFAGLKTQVS